MTRYVLYNYDTDKLDTKTVYVDYDDAVAAIGRLKNVVIFQLCMCELKEVS